MHCFASENQAYTGTVIFGVESLKYLKGQETNCWKMPLRQRPIFVMENIFCRKVRYSKHQRNGFLKDCNIRQVYDFPPSDLSFSGCTHAHAKCPPVQQHLSSLNSKLGVTRSVQILRQLCVKKPKNKISGGGIPGHHWLLLFVHLWAYCYPHGPC